MPAGRPTDYNDEIVAKICERLAGGESVVEICKDKAMPSKKSVFLWIGKYPEFSDKYTKAKLAGIEVLAEELLDIADNSTNDWMERNDPDNPGYATCGEAIARSRLRVDTRKWILSKLVPKKYGEKLSHTGPGGGPIQNVNHTIEVDMADEEAVKAYQALIKGE